jgi:hypothetical protein
MKFRKILIPMLLFIITISTLGVTPSKASKGDIIQNILSYCGGEVQNYGLTVSFSTITDLEEDKKSILDIVKFLCESEKGQKTNIYTKDSNYGIDFSTDNSDGYVESFTSDGANSISININVKGDQKNSVNLKSKVEKAIYNSGIVPKEKLVYFDYIKSFINSKDIRKINNGIIDIIKESGGRNIDTVQLDRGYSNIALTGQYESINVDGKEVDLNFAIMDYNSNSSLGCYLIIGTPEIMISY